MNKTIAVIRGDGIGPEIVGETIGVLDAAAKRFGHVFRYEEAPMGGNAIDVFGVPLPDSSLQTCLASDSVLLGAVGGPKWDAQPSENRPERGLLRLRGAMGLYSNIRPARMFPDLSAACPLRADIAARGIDFVVVRELIGGVYFGKHSTRQENGQAVATDIMAYSEQEIRRIAHVAFRMARKRRRRVTSVDKANVLDTSRLWRKTVCEVAEEYPDVELRHMYVDNAAMQLVRDPSQFDVLVTENLFGDILSDEASQITGSIGMIPSASLGDGSRGLYEPIHGSAPDIAGQDKANPIGTILAAAMMLRYSFDMAAEADAVEGAVSEVLRSGWRCGDILDEGGRLVGCREMGRLIRESVARK
jgi:3-isopropylmalate dehydrogenase